MWGGDACVALAGGGKRAQEQDEGDGSVPSPPNPSLNGRYFIMTLGKRLRTRRGGGRVVWGGDACVAPVLSRERLPPPPAGATPHIHHTPAFRGRYFIMTPGK